MASCTSEPLKALRAALDQFSSVIAAQKNEMLAVVQDVVVQVESEWDKLDTAQTMVQKKRKSLVRIQDAMLDILADKEVQMPAWIQKELLEPLEDSEDNIVFQKLRQSRRPSQKKRQSRQTTPPQGRGREFEYASSFAMLRDNLTMQGSFSRESSSSLGTSSVRGESSPHTDINPAWSATSMNNTCKCSPDADSAGPSSPIMVRNKSLRYTHIKSEFGMHGGPVRRSQTSPDFAIENSSTDEETSSTQMRKISSEVLRNDEVPDSWTPMRNTEEGEDSDVNGSASSSGDSKESSDSDTSQQVHYKVSSSKRRHIDAEVPKELRHKAPPGPRLSPRRGDNMAESLNNIPEADEATDRKIGNRATVVVD